MFPDLKRGAAVSASTIRKIPKEMGYDGIASPHGFTSSFRTWCSEETSFDKGVIEAALAHRQSELDEAYHRGSFLQKRRTLMQHWADYLEGRAVQAGGEVVALRR